MNKSIFSVAEIRQSFLDFFAQKGHTVVPSSALVPINDPTLMFTNSGMVQFKDVFLGTDKRPYVRAASVQACLRAGGKHNDLENVGYTARHHTFFEMLGNWSFGDYFKRDSLKWGWELLTQVYKLPPERLLATVYHEDDEAYDIWTKELGLSPDRVIRIGDNKGKKYASDNFWMMADTGPCGPCSEIFYDHGAHIAGGPPGSPGEDGDRFIEIWNHVFMQFEMHEDGSLTKLPAPCVDTGMGLERLAAILQNVHSNYEIDLFDALIKAAARETQCQDLKNPSLKVIADHIRATSFLVSDGVIPSNEGRGYVQRRIIRRAIRHGYKLGQKKPFFYKLVADLVGLMGQAYPQLAKEAKQIEQTLKTEEERFFETLSSGMQILEAEIAKGEKVISGDVAFKLHDTFGFPLDLTNDVCRERNIAVDETAFNVAMNQQKEQARAAGKFKMQKALEYDGPPSKFVGYQTLKQSATVWALYADSQGVQVLQSGQSGAVILDKTPFYAESGGQVGDQGVLSSQDNSVVFEVHDTQKLKADVYIHYGTVKQGTLTVGMSLQATVDSVKRQLTMRHHSATHLMHKALRTVLGEHVQQKGSWVNYERTRFDFTHTAPVTREQILAVEKWVNAQILANQETQTRQMSMAEAQQTGAMMLFGEKYGETVRVLNIGESVELCGGTHVTRVGDIGLFKIVTETGVAAGVRRIEAVVGEQALAYVQNMEETVEQTASTLKVLPNELPQRTQHMLEHTKQLEKELAQVKTKLALMQADQAISTSKDINGVKVLSVQLHNLDAQTLREAVVNLKTKLQDAVVVLAVSDGQRVNVVVGIHGKALEKLKAGELVNHVASQLGGKGGGKPDLAMAAGTDVKMLKQALDSVETWVLQRSDHGQ